MEQQSNAGGRPSFYQQCIALFEHVQRVLTPENLLRSGIEEYNRRIAEFSQREADRG